jgi:hypothetical protein
MVAYMAGIFRLCFNQFHLDTVRDQKNYTKGVFVKTVIL